MPIGGLDQLADPDIGWQPGRRQKALRPPKQSCVFL
jgi:hypothetical protein